MKFRKKSVAVEAVRYRSGETLDSAFVRGTDHLRYTEEGTLLLDTFFQGVMEAQPGDWIIRGIGGGLSVWKPDMFEATYEPAETAAVIAALASCVETLEGIEMIALADNDNVLMQTARRESQAARAALAGLEVAKP